jgi:hypothetical protein
MVPSIYHVWNVHENVEKRCQLCFGKDRLHEARCLDELLSDFFEVFLATRNVGWGHGL